MLPEITSTISARAVVSFWIAANAAVVAYPDIVLRAVVFVWIRFNAAPEAYPEIAVRAVVFVLITLRALSLILLIRELLSVFIAVVKTPEAIPEISESEWPKSNVGITSLIILVIAASASALFWIVLTTFDGIIVVSFSIIEANSVSTVPLIIAETPSSLVNVVSTIPLITSVISSFSERTFEIRLSILFCNVALFSIPDATTEFILLIIVLLLSRASKTLPETWFLICALAASVASAVGITSVTVSLIFASPSVESRYAATSAATSKSPIASSIASSILPGKVLLSCVVTSDCTCVLIWPVITDELTIVWICPGYSRRT